MKIEVVKKEKASEMILGMMIAAVLTILGMRLFLKLTSNPEVAFGDWHIAHMLWGGLLMMVALISLLSFHGKSNQRWSMIAGGVGWGLFIDEVGKYITRSNDYWFRPAIIIIYISFILLFLLYRYFNRFRPKNNLDLFYSVLTRLEEVGTKDLEKNEKRSIEIYLEKILKNEKDENLRILCSDLLVSIRKIEPIPDWNNERGVDKWLKGIKHRIRSLIEKKSIKLILGAYSIFYIVDKFWDSVRLLFAEHKIDLIEQYYVNYDFFGRTDVYMISLKIVFDLLSALLYGIGWYFFVKKKRLRGIVFFQYGLYINIFLAAVFKFYFEQFSGIFSLILAIVVLELLAVYKNKLIRQIQWQKGSIVKADR